MQNPVKLGTNYFSGPPGKFWGQCLAGGKDIISVLLLLLLTSIWRPVLIEERSKRYTRRPADYLRAESTNFFISPFSFCFASISCWLHLVFVVVVEFFDGPRSRFFAAAHQLCKKIKNSVRKKKSVPGPRRLFDLLTKLVETGRMREKIREKERNWSASSVSFVVCVSIFSARCCCCCCCCCCCRSR